MKCSNTPSLPYTGTVNKAQSGPYTQYTNTKERKIDRSKSERKGVSMKTPEFVYNYLHCNTVIMP